MKRINKKIITLLLACVPLLMYPQSDKENSVMFERIPAEYLKNVSVKTTSTGGFAYSVTDLTYQEKERRTVTDLVLSFDKKANTQWKDDTTKYNILYSNYSFHKSRGSLGGSSALFYKQNHRVEIETTQNLWLGSCTDLGSFTIEFRFSPYSLQDESVLFSRLGYFSGKKRGISIAIKHKRIVARFYDMFIDNDGNRYSVFLNKGKVLAQKRWYHFSVSYDRISGKLAKFINGEEVEAIYVTQSKQAYDGVFIPSFADMDRNGSFHCVDSASAVIGVRYRGLLDEFRISYKYFEDLVKNYHSAYVKYKGVQIRGRKPSNNSGMITSPVYQFPSTGTRVTLFKWDKELPKDTFIWMQFRVSDEYFDHDSELPVWSRVKNNQHGIYLKKLANGNYLTGKYYQWRAYLVPSPDGKHSPLLSNIYLQYTIDTAPNAPMFVEVVRNSDRSVRIRWKKNVESDIYGYKIYYGIKPGKYDGIINVINGKPITNSHSSTNYIEVTLTNDLIDENRTSDQRSLLTYPVLENTVLYYIAVSAYDAYKPSTSFNHESKLSKTVTGRPYAGSEID